MMYLHNFLGVFPPSQSVLIYTHDPRIAVYDGSIAKLRYVDVKRLVVVMAEYSMNQLLIKVHNNG